MTRSRPRWFRCSNASVFNMRSFCLHQNGYHWVPLKNFLKMMTITDFLLAPLWQSAVLVKLSCCIPSPQAVANAEHGLVWWQVVAGGGAVEAALSVYLENLATTLGSREQLAIAEFAEALLIIPKVWFSSHSSKYTLQSCALFLVNPRTCML